MTVAGRFCWFLLVLSLGMLSARAGAQDHELDPNAPSPSRLDRFNQANIRCNDWLADHVWEEVARGYNFVVPKWGQRRVASMIRNLEGPRNLVNSLFQGRLRRAGIHLARFLVDTTLGVAGAFDIGESRFGLRAPPETFNETLGVWGIGSGSFLVLPLVGETSLRGLAGMPVDSATHPLSWLLATEAATAASMGTRVVDGVAHISLRMPEADASEREWDAYEKRVDMFMQTAYVERKELFLENEAYDVEE